MKKFLIYLGAIVATVALGCTVFYLVRNNESMSISMSEVYVNTGDTFSIDFNHENEKAYTDVEIVLAGGDTDSTVQKVGEEETSTGKTYTFKAGSPGLTQITFRTSNENFRNLSCKVYVGDGSADYPFYITTAEQLQRIGTPEEQEKSYGGYTLSSCYKLMNNIILKDGSNKTGCWLPIGSNALDEGGHLVFFTGSFNGNGKTINNVMIDKDQYNEVSDADHQAGFVNAGLFHGIGQGGLVYGLKVEGIRVVGTYENVGTIAGINYGIIESCQVTGAELDVRDSAYVGGIVGKNLSTYNKTDDSYERFIARVDRCSFSGTIGLSQIEKAVQGEDGTYTNVIDKDTPRLKGIVGGLVGLNEGGIVIYSYAEGLSWLGEGCIFGGIVGINKDVDLKNAAPSSSFRYPTDYVGGNVKNCYSTLDINSNEEEAAPENTEETAEASGEDAEVINTIGGIIGYNITHATEVLVVNGVQFNIALEGAVAELGGEYQTIGIDNNKVIGNYYKYNEEVGNEYSIYGIAATGISTEEKDLKNIMTHLKSLEAYVDKTDAEIYKEVMRFVALPKTEAEMKKQTTFISHSKDQAGTELVPWKFDACWTISEDRDFPRLIYTVMSISDDMEEAYDNIIKTGKDLAEMQLNGNYYIAADIDMSFWENGKLWVPIGTEKNPFNGTLRAGLKSQEGGVREYYTISHLRISDASVDALDEVEEVKAYRYAGLFGAIGKTGKVYDLHIEQSSFAHKGTDKDPDANDETVAYNGYIGAIAGVNKGEIIRPVVSGCWIQGDCYVGGIVGVNQTGGNISGAVVKNTTDDSGANKTATTVLLKANVNAPEMKVYVGGIAGYVMSGSGISGATTYEYNSTSGKVEEKTINTLVDGDVTIEVRGVEDITITAYVGGIAGFAKGTISGALVHLTGLITAGDELNGYAGGIAGYLEGSTISGCKVSAVIEVGSKTYVGKDGDRTPETYVGGLVGAMKGEGSRVSNSATYETSLTGRNVGGLVGTISVATTFALDSPNKAKAYFVGERTNVPSLDEVTACVNLCFAENLNISGAYRAGGLACVMEEGLMTNCYVNSPNGAITSDLPGASLAGFVHDINFGSSKGDSSNGAVIAYAYVAIKVEAVNGKAWAESSTAFKSPTNYSAGFIASYVYDSDVMNKDVKNKAEVQLGGWGVAEKATKGIAYGVMWVVDKVGNFFSGGKGDIDDSVYEFYQGISTGSMMNGNDNKTIAACGFDGSIWNVNSGSYMSLKNVSIPQEWRP